MKRVNLLIIIFMFLFTSCNLDYVVDKTITDIGWIITIKRVSRNNSWSYWYKLEMEDNHTSLGWYSNKNYGVGDTIWMGARWGKKSNVDLDN